MQSYSKNNRLRTITLQSGRIFVTTLHSFKNLVKVADD